MHALSVNAHSPHVMHAVPYRLKLAGVSVPATLLGGNLGVLDGIIFDCILSS
jgi:hypothetical protein